LGSWALGILGPWALGPLGSWAKGLLGPWALGPLGSWALVFMPLELLVPWALSRCAGNSKTKKISKDYPRILMTILLIYVLLLLSWAWGYRDISFGVIETLAGGT
jgi:hypothetical protein